MLLLPFNMMLNAKVEKLQETETKWANFWLKRTSHLFRPLGILLSHTYIALLVHFLKSPQEGGQYLTLYIYSVDFVGFWIHKSCTIIVELQIPWEVFAIFKIFRLIVFRLGGWKQTQQILKWKHNIQAVTVIRFINCN